MRRALPFVLLVAVLAALGIGAAVSSGDNDKESKRAASVTPVAAQTIAHHRAGGMRHGGMLRMLANQVLTSGAKRLGVEGSALRKAARTTAKAAMARRFDAAGLTATDKANLKACRRAFVRRSSGCDRAAAKASLRKLHTAALPDLAKEKELIAGDLATALGKTSEEVLTAARAELELRLGQGVTMGFLSANGRELALGCFDAPATCDVGALHDEVTKRFGKRFRRSFRHP